MNDVSVQRKTVTIPTYEAGEPSKHPMFFEKRVYQGSSGRVYPHPVTEKISEEKVNKKYTALFIENDYLSVIILPELGGKVYRIYDKTNGYDAVYCNGVIKPSLVGLAGPWTAGGIEFNWPQQHRPSTFDCVDYVVERHEDGSATVWCGETENMYHTKGMAGFTLYPGKAYLEIRGQLYNPTDMPQTFLWWSNPAVPVNENTQTIFPPDVWAVMDHDKRSMSKFPVATGVYYDIDYSEGVDISRCANIPVPTAYMVPSSEYDFVGNYDYGKGAGILHIADHHISPGKKLWTWGNGNFGKAWMKNLTDDSGDYIELMAGVYTNNQPDFTFLMPYEEKNFRQYFMPYKGIGAVKNATLDVMANLEIKAGRAHIMLYAPARINVDVVLSGGVSAVAYMKESVTLRPEDVYDRWIDLDDGEKETDLKLVIRRDGDVILTYSPREPQSGKLPEPAAEIEPPKEISSMEELYLAAVHLEQNRHATRRPEDYYLEGLRREPDNIRMNNGYGKILYKKGLFEEAEKHFRAACEKSVMFNPNPYDCEPFYNLGLALKMQMKNKEAYDAFYKATWDGKMQDKAFYQLACVSAKLGRFGDALEFTNQALMRGTHNMRARNLKTALLRHCGMKDEAIKNAAHTMALDPLDFGSRYELYILTQDFDVLNELTMIMRDNLQNYIELSIGYAEANLFSDAAKVLALVAQSDKPMLHYYMAYYSDSDVELEVAEKCPKGYSFPNRLHDIAVLNYAIERNPKDWFARYSLGNLYYDKGVWFKAIDKWREALEIDGRNSFIMRNLAIANYNKLNDPDAALKLMERAALYSPDDARIYYELDMLRKLTNYPLKKRLKDMTDKPDLVESRDDLFTEYIILLNSERYYSHALRAIKRHNFHPWEGGEGIITRQYKLAHMGCATECMRDEDYEEAVKHLEQALVYPENLGEGKLVTSMDNDVYFLMGCAYEKFDKIKSIEYFKKAAEGRFSLKQARYYNDIPPEMYWFRTRALGKLGDIKKERGGYNTLINYCEEHESDSPEIDYFAISLPKFTLFEGDLKKENYVHCCYMAALGYTGLGMKDKANEMIARGLRENCSHQGLIYLSKRDTPAPKLKSKDKTILRAAKWSTSKS